MLKPPFEYKDYKSYLNDKIKSHPQQGRGLKSAISKKLGCQTAYISQVLNGEANLSLEQADGINQFFHHTKDESQFFILLVEIARAGTVSLRKHFQSQIESLLEKRSVLKNRLDVKRALSVPDQTTYYSAWYYSAIHIATTIPEFRTKEALSKRLGLALPLVSQALEFLLTVGLVVLEGDRFKIGTAQIHLGQDAVMANRSHLNWRLQAMRSLENSGRQNLFYTDVVSLSKEDVSKIKETLMKTIQELRAVIKDSPEETLQCLSLDFFEV